MENQRLGRKSLLSTLWVFILFNLIFRDLHQMLNPGEISAMMSLDIPEGFMLLYAMVLEIPMVMILLSRVLPDKAAKWTNLILAPLFLIGFLTSITDLDDLFFVLMQSGALAAIMILALKMPVLKKASHS